MSAMSAQAAQELGRRLHEAGFRPLPDVDDDGELIGTRLWRVRAGYVEYLALRPDGHAHAVRAEARFDYRRPAEHGAVAERRAGYAANALNWLLSDTDASGRRLPRPYAAPNRSTRCQRRSCLTARRPRPGIPVSRRRTARTATALTWPPSRTPS